MLLCLDRINVGGRQRRAPDDTRVVDKRTPHTQTELCHTVTDVSYTAERHKHNSRGSEQNHKSKAVVNHLSFLFKEKGFDGYTVGGPTACEISLRPAQSLRYFGLDQSFVVTDWLTYVAISRATTGSPVTFLLKILDAVSSDGCNLFPVKKAIIAAD